MHAAPLSFRRACLEIALVRSDVLLRCAAACLLLFSAGSFGHAAADRDLFAPSESEHDCSETADAESTVACRLRQPESIAAVHGQIMQGHALRRDGDSLVIAHRGDARQVLMAGGLTFPLSRIPSTDLWVVRLRVPDLDRLVLSFRFLRDGERPSLEVEPMRWRGPDAPPAWPVATSLQGVLSEMTIASKALGAERRMTVYEPPRVGDDPLSAIVYIADGKLLRVFMETIEPLTLSRRLPRIVWVGPHAADGPQRGREYVQALGAKSGEFAAYQTFVLEEVIPHVERRYHRSDAGSLPRWLFGVSNGADWALETGLHHPEMFACIIAFSPGWPLGPARVRAAAGRDVSVALASGTLEHEFHENTAALAQLLAAQGIRHQHQQWVAGHDMEVWVQALPDALDGCLQPRARP